MVNRRLDYLAGNAFVCADNIEVASLGMQP